VPGCSRGAALCPSLKSEGVAGLALPGLKTLELQARH
jgi:hypothetical protein